MKKLLLDNALEAWAMTISYCDQIMAGRVTLTNRKYFVSSLQNAIELFAKQHMLDVNDYRVAQVRKIDSNGEPMRGYFLASDLNTYFDNIYNVAGSTKRFFTIEFNAIIDIQKDIFSEFYLQNPQKNMAPTLKILKMLRNDETHFFIDADNYLKDEEFKSLYNLMIDFYEVLKFYNLLPFWGEPLEEYERFTFNRTPLNSFSFVAQIKSSDFVKKLQENIEGKLFPAGVGEEPYSMARDIIEYCDAYSKDDFDNLWSYLQALMKYHILEITEKADEDYVDGEKIYGTPYREYKVKI